MTQKTFADNASDIDGRVNKLHVFIAGIAVLLVAVTEPLSRRKV